MYAQFRSQFPMGSLISELLKIHEGKFIVKASIQVGGSTLATGLSAATSIEQAEDQARVRALVVLGIEDRPYPTQAQLVNPELDASAARTTRARLSPPAQVSEFLPLTETTGQNALDMDWAIADQAARTFQPPEQQMSWYDADPEPLPASYAAPHNSGLSAFPSPQGRSSEAFQKPTNRKPNPEPRATNTVAAPIDLSDIIAHTDVELKRLGWNNAQGRRYLEQTYGKRSRQHLSDSELTEFLDFLRTQPAPSANKA